MPRTSTATDPLLLAAIRARMRTDPLFRRAVGNVPVEEVAREYVQDQTALAPRQGTESAPQPEPPTPRPSAQRAASHAPRTRRTIPKAIMDLLSEINQPMTRQDIYDEIVRRGWIEPNNIHKTVGTAVLRLLKKGIVEELPGKKPRNIRLIPRQERIAV